MRTAIFEYIEGWYNPRRRNSTLGYLSPAEFEQQHAELAVEASISANGSVTSIAPNASDGVTTRRVSTAGVDFAPHASISPENDPVAQAGSAQAATTAVKGRTAAVGLSEE